MKNLFLACVVAVAALLGACTSQGGFTAITIASVQQAAVNSCKFLPTAETVTNIIAAGVPGLSTAALVADAICAAVVPSSAMAAAPGGPSVGGVAIKGAFTK